MIGHSSVEVSCRDLIGNFSLDDKLSEKVNVLSNKAANIQRQRMENDADRIRNKAISADEYIQREYALAAELDKLDNEVCEIYELLGE